jgi:hypothetical protein
MINGLSPSYSSLHKHTVFNQVSFQITRINDYAKSHYILNMFYLALH